MRAVFVMSAVFVMRAVFVAVQHDPGEWRPGGEERGESRRAVRAAAADGRPAAGRLQLPARVPAPEPRQARPVPQAQQEIRTRTVQAHLTPLLVYTI